MAEFFGYTKDGRKIDKITLKDESGNYVTLISFGASIQSLVINNTDVCLGYDSVAGYEENDGCLGGVIGRCTNRIGGACFTIDGTEYNVTPNKGTYHIHGGNIGFFKRVWDYEEQGNSVVFSLYSPDGDEGYPGNCTAQVKYTFEHACLKLEYLGICDRKTVMNFTNHSYFNLNGAMSKSTVHNHKMFIDSDFVAYSDSNSVPTGKLVNVKGTPFDFTVAKEIGRDIDNPYELLSSKRGYDHNYLVKDDGVFKRVAICGNEKISMQVWTDMPAVVVYTANYLDGQIGKGNVRYLPRYGVCFETQYMTNAVNLEGFAKPVFGKDSVFKQHTEFRFEY